jgi:hypothetical protein
LCCVGDGGHDLVRSGGGADRRKLHAAAALQRRFARRSARLDHRRRPSPFIATALFAAYAGSLPIAIYIALCAVIGLVSTSLLTGYTNKDISAEYEHV